MCREQERSANIAFYNGCLVDRRSFEYHVEQVRFSILEAKADIAQPPTKILNLCENRYHFLVVFTASMLAGRTTVMPANSSEGELTRLTQSNEGMERINEQEVEEICRRDKVNSGQCLEWNITRVPASMIVAELYTSGSTGEPSVNPKTWGQLVSGAQQVCERFGLKPFSQFNIIATVPPQHMFGFEMSIVLPLVCGVAIHEDKPFYPMDLQRVLREMPSPRILVTTPIHLKACMTLTEGWPEIQFVLSATANLPEEVARQAETIMNTDVKEVYGCSEVGAIATRQMTKNPDWQLLPDYSLDADNEAAQLQTATNQKSVLLPDKLEILSNGFFRLVARADDMIKIGGKRGSLAELTARIKALPGVEDAVVFRQEHKVNQRERLAALVVAQGGTSEQLREALLKNIDPIFLPRPLCIVPALPYNSTGKLPRADLIASLSNSMKELKKC